MQCVYGRPPFRETCTIGPPATLFDDVLLICNYDYEVDCGDRPIIDGNTPSPTIPTTTVQVTTTTVSVRLHHTYFTPKHARARSQTSADFDSCIYIYTGPGKKNGSQVARIFQARPDRIGKQQQEQNSRNLGTVFFCRALYIHERISAR